MTKVKGTTWTDDEILDVLRRLESESICAVARSLGLDPRSIRRVRDGWRAAELRAGMGRAEPAAPPMANPFPWMPGGHVEREAETRRDVERHPGPFGVLPSQDPQHAGPAMGTEGPRFGASLPGAQTAAPCPTSADPTKDPTCHCPKAPAGYHLRGVSTLVDAAGQPVQQWIKTSRDREEDLRERLLEAIRSLPEPFRVAHQPKPAARDADADLLAVYPVADAHFGMYAWGDESGSDYDIDIAERLHLEAIHDLTEHAQPAEQALVVSLGDFLHCDSNMARTTQSGNPLDTDTRWQKVLRVGVRTFRAIVEAALQRHKSVRVVSCRGNHDSLSSYMLALAIEAFYARDPRVSVDTSPAPFHWHRFGRCLFGMTHGDGPKPEQLPGIMASLRAVDWGATSHRRWLTGHVHHKRLSEFPGCIVEGFGATAARDAWTAGMGYVSERDMRVDCYHREDGLRSFYRVPIRSAVA